MAPAEPCTTVQPITGLGSEAIPAGYALANQKHGK